MATGTSVQGRVLEITVLGCSNLNARQWIGKQDPYVLIDYAGQESQTLICKDGGRNPSFNQSFQFTLIDGIREINASVWNNHRIQRNDHIGSTTIPLNKVIESGNDRRQLTLTNNENKVLSGVLNVVLQVARTGLEQVAPGTGAPACGHGAPFCGHGAPACGHGAPFCGHGAPFYEQGVQSSGHGAQSCRHGPPAHGHGAPGCGQGVSPYGAAVQLHYTQQHPYPPPPWGGHGPSPAAAQSYMPIYQDPFHSPQPVAYVGAQSSYYPAPTAPPMYYPAR